MSVVGPGVNRADERGVCGILGGRAPLIKTGARVRNTTALCCSVVVVRLARNSPGTGDDRPRPVDSDAIRAGRAILVDKRRGGRCEDNLGQVGWAGSQFN